MYKPGASIFLPFSTQNSTTGVAANADSLPTTISRKNGIVDPSFTLNVWNTGTGTYQSSGTIPSNYIAGDCVNVLVTAAVNSVTGTAVLTNFVVDTYYNSDLYSSVSSGTTQIRSDLSSISTNTAFIPEILGLLGKYSGLRNTTYSAGPSNFSNLISYDLCIYDGSTNAQTNDGVTGLVHKYSVVNTYDGGGNVLTCITTKIS